MSHKKVRKVRIEKSTRKDKQFMVQLPDSKGTTIHFGSPKATAKPGTDKGNAYCTRSAGMRHLNDPYSANFWSRIVWGCKKDKSYKNKSKKAGELVNIDSKLLK